MPDLEKMRDIKLPQPNPNGVTIEQYYAMGSAHVPDVSGYAFPLYRLGDKLLGITQSPNRVIANLQVFFGILQLIAFETDGFYDDNFRAHTRSMIESHEGQIATLFEEKPPEITEAYLLQLEPIRVQWSALMTNWASR